MQIGAYFRVGPREGRDDIDVADAQPSDVRPVNAHQAAGIAIEGNPLHQCGRVVSYPNDRDSHVFDHRRRIPVALVALLR